jgi:O-antigen/teichoic acid export membrane protein
MTAFNVFVARLPTLAVLVVGLVLVLRQRRRRPGRALNLGLAGLVLLIGTIVVGALFTIYHDQLIRLRSDELTAGEIVAAMTWALGLGNLVGLGLLVAGLVGGPGNGPITRRTTGPLPGAVTHHD